MSGDTIPMLFTVAAAAERLSISRATAERLIATGALPSVRVGTLRRVAQVDLDAFVDSLPRSRTGLAS